MTSTSRTFLEIAEDFTVNHVDLLLKREFADLYDKTMAMVGGSVSFGLADEESDIDYGVIIDLVEGPADLSRAVLESLGGRFHRHRGVLIDIHLSRFSSLEAYHLLSGGHSLRDWEGMDPTDVFLLQNMRILRDPEGKLHSLKERVQAIPEAIIERRIAGRWGFLCLWLDYVRQCMKRGDPVGSVTFVGRTMQEIMTLGFLLNEKPYPDPKYRFKIFLNLPFLSDQISPLLDEVSSISDPGRQYDILHGISRLYAEHMARNGLIDVKYIKDWLQCFDDRNQVLF